MLLYYHLLCYYMNICTSIYMVTDITWLCIITQTQYLLRSESDVALAYIVSI